MHKAGFAQMLEKCKYMFIYFPFFSGEEAFAQWRCSKARWRDCIFSTQTRRINVIWPQNLNTLTHWEQCLLETVYPQTWTRQHFRKL